MIEPRITFGLIVLNGEPFTRYNLRAFYPYAHQIIVVEGACRSADGVATKDGHSSDGTIEVLKAFKKEEDPENKLIIVTAEDEGNSDGFWAEKTEMSQAYAKRVTGNFLWQVDLDEFYLDMDILKIIEILKTGVDTIDFNAITFWGGIDYAVDGFWMIIYPHNINRIFAWGKGYRYVNHRPPTVLDEKGVDTRSKHYITADETSAMNVFLYHYSLIFPKQVESKISYYSKAEWCCLNDIKDWKELCYTHLQRPFHVHNVYDHISWLKPFNDQHPTQIINMMSDIHNGKLKVQLRRNTDIEQLLNKKSYKISRKMLERWAHFSSKPFGNKIYRYSLAFYRKAYEILHPHENPFDSVNSRKKIQPEITFGMIVLNSEPFTRYNLRSLYPYAHQIIVVEGACQAAAGIATKDGHSKDDTLETLQKFKNEEDPDNKLIVVTAEDEGYPDGFWPEKVEMSQAYAKRSTGNYLWQVDSDEFYLEEDMLRIIKLLKYGVDAVDFNTVTFWGGLEFIVDSFWQIAQPHNFNRIFAWGPGYQYTKHRPPTVVDADGVDTRKKCYIKAEQMETLNIKLLHYALLFPKQVSNKVAYYTKAAWCQTEDGINWAEESFFNLRNPFRVHNMYNHLSWLKKFNGRHPVQILKMIDDIRTGKLTTETRSNQDVCRLLKRVHYRAISFFLEKWARLVSLPLGKLIYQYGQMFWRKFSPEKRVFK